ncbi:hypothetical protein [Guptibacillus spartinae]|uniref:hypothetical protein n=1 Tax=Guptibacillus spartinae TaxID=3025679 RepID=UPI00235F4D20|nr:hypothetical protein [Pseudalkalibacillus spartinae]
MKSSLYFLLLIVAYALVLGFAFYITPNAYARFFVSIIGVGISLWIVLKINKK